MGAWAHFLSSEWCSLRRDNLLVWALSTVAKSAISNGPMLYSYMVFNARIYAIYYYIACWELLPLGPVYLRTILYFSECTFWFLPCKQTNNVFEVTNGEIVLFNSSNRAEQKNNKTYSAIIFLYSYACLFLLREQKTNFYLTIWIKTLFN